jgi:hypothetical protein
VDEGVRAVEAVAVAGAHFGVEGCLVEVMLWGLVSDGGLTFLGLCRGVGWSKDC